MKRVVRGVLWVLACLLTIMVVLVADEVFMFATRTEASAQDKATQDFLRECARRGFDPNEFSGPVRMQSPPQTFGFVWVNPSNGNQIATMVSYLPAGVESWQTRQQDGKYAPYCEATNASCR